MCRSEKCTTNGTERHAGRSLQGVCVKRKHLDKSGFDFTNNSIAVSVEICKRVSSVDTKPFGCYNFPESNKGEITMDIQVLQLLEGAKAAKGLTVIIDVFRAFTVEAYMAKNNAAKIIPVKDVQTAFDYKAEHPDALLCGERNGVMIEGFDFGNSPADIQPIDLTGKTLVHTTSAGTQGIANASGADEIITGSLANAKAIARYIKSKQPQYVSLVCMGWNADEETAEDTLCGQYIKSILEGQPMADIREKAQALRYSTGAKFFDPKQQDVFKEADFHLCVDVDAIDFVLRLKKSPDGLHYMERIDI